MCLTSKAHLWESDLRNKVNLSCTCHGLAERNFRLQLLLQSITLIGLTLQLQVISTPNKPKCIYYINCQQVTICSPQIYTRLYIQVLRNGSYNASTNKLVGITHFTSSKFHDLQKSHT